MRRRPRLAIGRPRLLPVTIGVMVALLGVKSTAIVRAALPAPDAAAPAAPPVTSAAPRPPAAAMAPAAAPAQPPQDSISAGERGLLLELRQRRSLLEAREAELATREAVLAGAEKRVADRVGELMSLQSRLEALDAARRAHDEANWRGLVKLYETMRPRDAAAIFNDLDRPVLLAVLDRMKEAKAAAVLAAMLPDRARLATSELAQQRSAAAGSPAPAP